MKKNSFCELSANIELQLDVFLRFATPGENFYNMFLVRSTGRKIFFKENNVREQFEYELLTRYRVVLIKSKNNLTYSWYSKFEK